MEYIREPGRIEEKSMELIEQYLEARELAPGERLVVKRVIHTTGDPSYLDLVAFGHRAVEDGVRRLAAGGRIYCDVEMVRAGINRKATHALGLEPYCRIHAPDVSAAAVRLGITRAAGAMSEALAQQPEGGIFVIGNAPTALFTLLEAVTAGKANPGLVVGTPVGFVGAAESKEWLTAFPFPWITVLGTKGGSTIAAAVINALLAMVPGF